MIYSNRDTMTCEIALFSEKLISFYINNINCYINYYAKQTILSLTVCRVRAFLIS